MRSLSVESSDSQPSTQQQQQQQHHQRQQMEESEPPEPKETDFLLILPPRVPVSAATSCPLEGSATTFHFQFLIFNLFLTKKKTRIQLCK